MRRPLLALLAGIAITTIAVVAGCARDSSLDELSNSAYSAPFHASQTSEALQKQAWGYRKSKVLQQTALDPASVADAGTLVWAFEQNEIWAEQNFKGRGAVVGTVENVGRDLMGKAYVTLGQEHVMDDKLRRVQCFFLAWDQSSLSKLRPGNIVVIQGRIAGLMGNVLMEDCILLARDE